MQQNLSRHADTALSPDCLRTRTHLHAFVDGELTAHDDAGHALADLVTAHLGTCERCARLERQLHAMRAALRATGRRERGVVRATPSLRARAAAILSSH